mmetsp:Transcript_4008/g.10133  ORF Transcript_4008/g.10133 Transcript_4008/m.10133 type:complete len:112 (+) Transcript_4008:357-692(+)
MTTEGRMEERVSEARTEGRAGIGSPMLLLLDTELLPGGTPAIIEVDSDVDILEVAAADSNNGVAANDGTRTDTPAAVFLSVAMPPLDVILSRTILLYSDTLRDADTLSDCL